MLIPILHLETLEGLEPSKRRRLYRLLRYLLRLDAPGDYSVLEDRYGLDNRLLNEIES